MRTLVRGLALAVVLLPLAACGSSPAGPRAAVQRFGSALRNKDGAAACSALAPATRSELAGDAQQPCPQAVLDQGLPDPGAVRSVQVWGDRAIARTQGDVVFLGELPDGWRVVSAGCKAKPGGSYDCSVKGP